MITRSGLADEIDGFDLQIKALNDAKSAAYKAYREQLEDTGMEPRRASAEVAATKAAIVKRRKLRENPGAAREKDDMIDAILVEIMGRPSRAREDDAGSSNGRTADFGSANAGSIPAPVTTSHDPETGEITEQPETATQSADMAVGLAGPALAGSHPAANTKPAPISNPQASSSRQADSPASTSPEPGTHSDDFTPPAFLNKPKTAADYRPHCQHPEACGASGLHHCYTCEKVLSLESEAAL